MRVLLSLSAILVLFSTVQAGFQDGQQGYFNHLTQVFQPHNQKQFQEKVFGESNNQELSQDNYETFARNCSIFVHSVTGLVEKDTSVYDFLKSKIDFDLNRYKEDEGLEVGFLWKIFNKYLEEAGVTIKDPFIIGSNNIPPKRVPVSIRNVYTPVLATLWTAYVKPSGTHNKLSAGVLLNTSASDSYNITKTAEINLALKFFFSEKLFILKASLSEAVPEDGEPIKVGKASLVKAIKIKPHGPPHHHDHHDHKSYSHEPKGHKQNHDESLNFLKSHHKRHGFGDSEINPFIPASFKEQKAMKKEESKGFFPFGLIKSNKPCNEIAQQESRTHRPSKVSNQIENTSSKTCKKEYAKYGVFGQATAMVMCPKYSNKIIDKIRFNEPIKQNQINVVADTKQNERKDGKEHEDIKHDEHDHHHHHEHPKIVAFAEEKGFVFSKGIGFGFTDTNTAIVKTPWGGVFSTGTGVSKFGICYDP